MRITKIEMNGFKSFADKTVLEMHPGITAIVGPNGCGKSNVVDAFRWALGEQSAKNLRGDKMEEVIFNGTENKKQKGMAEVSIVLAGVNRETPSGMPVDEVRVTRRLFRSGESEYMINNNPCRLRDIREIFLDTGLELKSYAILEQGKVGDIINSKPTDRRFLIEEAAGVVKYKVRKQEAVSKLESARNNLLRITDIVGEVRRQKKAIERQARKAERYKVLAEEAKDLELATSRRDFGELEAETGRVSGELRDLKLKEVEASSLFQQKDAEVEERRLALAEEEKAIEAAGQDMHNLQIRVKDLEGRVELLKTERSNLEERTGRSVNREAELKVRKETLEEELSRLAEREERLRTEVGEFQRVLEDGVAGVRSVEEEMLDIEEEIENGRRDLFRQAEGLAHARNELSNISSEIESRRQRDARAVEEAETLKAETAEAEAGITAMREQLGERINALKNLTDEREELLRDLEAARNQRRETEDSFRVAKEEWVAESSRLKSMKDMDESLSGYREGIRKLVQGKGQDHDLRIEALIVDSIQVPGEYEAAIEAVLGERIQSLVMENHAEVGRALKYLRENDYGRGVFLPSAARPVPLRNDVPAGGGVLGKAADLVSAKEPFRGIVSNLLANTVVVQDMESALTLWENSSMTFVTLQGEVLEPSGLVHGGQEKGLLSMKREIRDLEAGVEKTRMRAESLESSLKGLVEQIAQKESALEEMNSSIRVLEREVEERKREESISAEALNQRNRRLDLMESERKEAAAALEGLKATRQEKNSEFERLEAEKAATGQKMEALQAEKVEKRRLLETLKNETTDRRVEFNSRKTSLENLTHEINRQRQTAAEVESQINALLTERARMAEVIARTDDSIRETSADLSRLVTKVKEDGDALNERKGLFSQSVLELRAVEEDVRRLRPRVDELRGRIGELEVRAAQLEMKTENLVARIQDNYGLDLARVEPAEVPEGAAERLAELRQKMLSMGPVSLGSLEEHEELTERYEFLLKQQEDLNQSISSLEEAISKINRTTKDRLRTAYEELREKFQQVFKILFGGGRADLVLVGEESILDAGIDIMVQPPGKRLQNISLLSGGEKALTAISILFSGFLIKPSPLCVLDEVDAPLDESNTDRFATLLVEIAKDTQFVTITHNRRSMESADVLYGVTMEEAGVTKLVSMKMTELAEIG